MGTTYTVKAYQLACHHLLVSGFGAMSDGVVCCKCGLDKYPEAIIELYTKAVAEDRVFSEGDENYDYLSHKAVQARDRAELSVRAENVWN
jgi:hypothetical protein